MWKKKGPRIAKIIFKEKTKLGTYLISSGGQHRKSLFCVLGLVKDFSYKTQKYESLTMIKLILPH